MERILIRLFPDDSTESSFNIIKYRDVKKGKIFLRRRSLKKFLEILHTAAIDYQNYRQGTLQTNLFQFDAATHPAQPDIYAQIDAFFDPTRFFNQTYDADE
jgi:hypothetical protein